MSSPTARFPHRDFRSVHADASDNQARRALAGHGTSGLGSIVLRVGDEAVTVSSGDEVTISDGTDRDAEVSVEFATRSAFSDFHHELLTVAGLHVTGGVRYLTGGYGEFGAWEPALRALYTGRAVFDPSDVDISDASRTFRSGEDEEALASFIDRFGFAHVRGVFSTAEIGEIDAEVRRAEQASRPDVAGSWWTRDADGQELPCQLHYLSLASRVIGALDDDPRIRRLVELTRLDISTHPDRALGTFAVLKRPAAADGLTNLPWHVDCGLGGHPVTCPGVHIGVQLTPSNPRLGAFNIVPGSHRSSVRQVDVIEGRLPTVTVDAMPGDVTVHVTHALHAAPAPHDPAEGRRTLYLGFGPHELLDAIGPGQAFDDLITQTGSDGHVRFDARSPVED